MNLRPHHLLCIQKFTGHGYSETFTEHMTSVVSELKNKRETEIYLMEGCDDLCTACPHNENGICVSLGKVDLMDKRVLAVCEFTYGDTVPWAELAKRAKKKIFETDEFNHICSDCQWFELCQNTKEAYYE